MSTQETDNVIILRHRPTIRFRDRLRLVRLDYSDRTGRKLNQGQFAELIGVKPGTYASWEAGNTKPEDLIATARHIFEVTGADPAWLLDVADDAPQGPKGPPGVGVPRFTWNEEAAGRARRLREAGPLVHDLDLAAA
jgi:transcriptional regulator with XRE-family HTH domain